jgi:hypothetical protein
VKAFARPDGGSTGPKSFRFLPDSKGAERLHGLTRANRFAGITAGFNLPRWAESKDVDRDMLIFEELGRGS